MIQADRLAETFETLVKIDSVSKHEGAIARELEGRLQALGAETIFDQAGEAVGGESGNLIARFEGGVPTAPILFSAHMDTVEPGRGIEPVLEDGIFTSAGDTILGADDKSALAVLLEVLQSFREDGIAHAPIDLVLTVCEELGLQGAKHLDFNLIRAKFGYVLDATDLEGVVTRAPGANKLVCTIHGKDAHAGAAPEKGINAIVLVSQAIAKLSIGRIDRETTCNIGLIEGGLATNIVPPAATVKGEVRSHDEAKLKAVTDTIIDAFQMVVDDYPAPDTANRLPRLEYRVQRDFHHTHIPEDHPLVVLVRQASSNLGRQMATKRTGGGADANIFFENGIMAGVIGTGMRDLHTVRESIALDDMVKTAELVSEIIKIHSESASLR